MQLEMRLENWNVNMGIMWSAYISGCGSRIGVPSARVQQQLHGRPHSVNRQYHFISSGIIWLCSIELVFSFVLLYIEIPLADLQQ